MKKQCLQISDFDKETIEDILMRAEGFAKQAPIPSLNKTVALLFYENSTRTLVSFDLAAKKLGLTVLNLDVNTSSEQKGEVVYDTIATIGAMGVDAFIVRHKSNTLIFDVASSLGENYHFLNAGSGMFAHPTQALLDMLTIKQHKQLFENLTVAVIGDLRHSRVANSFLTALKIFGVKEVRLVAPDSWHIENPPVGEKITDIREGLKGADVVMALRVQKERIVADSHYDIARFQADFCLTEEKLALAKPDAIVMHPGPMNRGIEISSEVADGPQSVILQQVKNGVFIRMAMLAHLLS